MIIYQAARRPVILAGTRHYVDYDYSAAVMAQMTTEGATVDRACDVTAANIKVGEGACLIDQLA